MYPVAMPNVRADSTINSQVVGAYSFGDEIRVIETVEGQLISGSTTWYQIWYENERTYIHSSLVSRNRPSTAVPQAVAPQSVAPQQPVQQPQSAPANNQRPANCAQAVEWGLTAQQAAEWSHLDRDNDGVACYGD